MGERKIRILLGKLGQGHKLAQLNLAKSLSEAGFEVIYTELMEPDALVRSALQEAVDHIGITLLEDANLQVFDEIMGNLKSEGVDYISVTVGGLVNEKDIPHIKGMGVKAFFPRGTTFRELAAWAKKNITYAHP